MKLSKYVKLLDGKHWAQRTWFNHDTGCMCIGADLIDTFTEFNITTIQEVPYWDLSSALGLTSEQLTQITMLNDQAWCFEDARKKISEYLESIGK